MLAVALVVKSHTLRKLGCYEHEIRRLLRDSVADIGTVGSCKDDR